MRLWCFFFLPKNHKKHSRKRIKALKIGHK
nr:MAG TPA: hypothetical protein [Caudoviricetes sp.]